MVAKYNEAKNSYESMKGDLDKMNLKVQFLEAKLEKNYHLEGLFTQLKEDYEELRREKQMLFDQSEQRIAKKNEQLKRILEDKDDLMRENLRLKKLSEEKEIEIGELVDDARDKENLLSMASDEQSKLEEVVESKQQRIE